MKKPFKIALISLFFLALLCLGALYVTTQDIAVLNPKGLVGVKERKLLIISSLLMLIVVVPVYILTFAFAWKYRETNKEAKYTPDWEHSHIAEGLWWGIPFVIIVILAILTWRSSHDLDPFKPIENGKKPLTIQVVALQWKWLFIYPEQGIASVNFAQFPVNTPIHFQITADAPMNSFWIPQLGGQIYAMPAMSTQLHLIAHEMGNYRGCSANLSGTGFAGMNFVAKVSSEDDFEAWVDTAKKAKTELSLREYNLLAEPSEYNPVTYYQTVEDGLYNRIVMKYSEPMAK